MFKAHAAFTYTCGVLNSAQTYDGTGVDSALNPHTFGAATQDDYIGNGAGGTGVLTLSSGTLTITAQDFKVGNGNATANSTIDVTGGTLNISQLGQWGGGGSQFGTGTLNIAGGATVNWQTSGSTEQNFMVGNGTNGNGTNGNFFDPVQALTDAQRGFCLLRRWGPGGHEIHHHDSCSARDGSARSAGRVRRPIRNLQRRGFGKSNPHPEAARLD